MTSFLFTVVIIVITILQQVTICYGFNNGANIACVEKAAQQGHQIESGDLNAGGAILLIDDKIYDPKTPIVLPQNTIVTISIESNRTIGIIFHIQPNDGKQDLTNLLQPVGTLLTIMSTCTAPNTTVVHNSPVLKPISSVEFDTTGLTGEFTLSINHLVAYTVWYFDSITLVVQEDVTTTAAPALSPVPSAFPTITSSPSVVVSRKPTPTPTSEPTPVLPSVTISSFIISYSAPNATMEPSDSDFEEVFVYTSSFLANAFINYYETQNKGIPVVEINADVEEYYYEPTKKYNFAIEWQFFTLAFEIDSDPIPTVNEVTLLLEEFIIAKNYTDALVTEISATNPFIFTEDVIIETELTIIDTPSITPTIPPTMSRSPTQPPSVRKRDDSSSVRKRDDGMLL